MFLEFEEGIFEENKFENAIFVVLGTGFALDSLCVQSPFEHSYSLPLIKHTTPFGRWMRAPVDGNCPGR